MDWLKKFGSTITGGLGANANMIPFIASAWNDYNNSGKYMDMATKYAGQMDPFGGQRAGYQDQLKSLMSDPMAYLNNSPDYKAALAGGMGALDSSMSAKGFGGSGHAADEAQAYGSQLAAQYLDKDRAALMQMAGANIGPGAAEDLIKTGITGSITAKNNALSNLMAAFTDPTKHPVDNTNPPPGGPTDILKKLAGSTNPADAAAAVAALVKRGWTQDDAAAAVKASLTGQGTNYTTNGQPWSPTNPDGYHSMTHPGQGGPTTGGTQEGDTITLPDGTQMTYTNGGWVPGDGTGTDVGPPAPDVPVDTTINYPDTSNTDINWLLGDSGGAAP
jgi:hypothetical protein